MNRRDHARVGECGKQVGIHARLGRGIETRRRLIHQYERASSGREDTTRERHAAALTARPIRGALRNGQFQAERRRLHEVGGASGFECGCKRSRRRRPQYRFTQTEILAESTFVDLRVLWNQCGLRA